MRILFIAPRLPLPADTGGKIRTFNLIKQIVKNHAMDLACFSFKDDDQKFVKELEDLGVAITLVPVKNLGLFKKISLVLFSELPYSAAKYYLKEMEEVVNKLAGKKNYDIVHFDHIHMAHYKKCFKTTPCLIDEHNVEYKILERCAGVEKSWIKKRMFLAQARKMKQFEARKVGTFSVCTSVSDEDGNILRELTDNRKPIETLPNGVNTEYFQGSGGVEKEADAVVFTGSMDWFPNDDAAIYFCEDILPRIWKINPNIKFYIVGKGPSKHLKSSVKDEPRIILTGMVDDVRVFVNRSKVFVVPLRIGGGTRLKILEAMSMKKAVVSTSIGAEGISYTNGSDIVLADDPQDFAENVVALINDSQRRQVLGSAGRKLVMGTYDWNIVGAKLLNVYRKTL